jgi:ribonuclease Z
LTHVSPRYFGPELAREAREVFTSTVVPRDFDVVEVPFAERGEPRLIKRGARPEARETPEPGSGTEPGSRVSSDLPGAAA